ncbi:alpha/beta-type small acid-soluble spore protein [Desulfolucanica intricata]|uniref:alpha/beta-type small acid-soluble spore protein n=1 Tax=Desulfolucanica intricata TaxID=1285191 RepID=UPI00082F6AFA|nr:alpha/beta-type small acid-soluble spore protein [Desulfolucanica intricata]
MDQFVKQGRLLPHSVLDQFKYEVADEIGVSSQIKDGYWGKISSEDCGRVGGKIGGNMVKVLVKKAEDALANGQKI